MRFSLTRPVIIGNTETFVSVEFDENESEADALAELERLVRDLPRRLDPATA